MSNRINVYIKGKFGGRVKVSAEVLEEHDKSVVVRLPGGDVITRHKVTQMPEKTRKMLEDQEREREKARAFYDTSAQWAPDVLRRMAPKPPPLLGEIYMYPDERPVEPL